MDLLEGFELQKLLADKGYDATYIVDYVGIDKAVILSRSIRVNPRKYDLRTLQGTKPCGADVEYTQTFQKGSHKIRQARHRFLIVGSYRCFSYFVKMNIDISY